MTITLRERRSGLFCRNVHDQPGPQRSAWRNPQLQAVFALGKRQRIQRKAGLRSHASRPSHVEACAQPAQQRADWETYGSDHGTMVLRV